MRVVILGEPSGGWLEALGPQATAWTLLPTVSAVHVCRPDELAALVSPSASETTVVIPFLEDDIVACPPSARALVPSSQALETCRDKRRFSAFMSASCLGHLHPREYSAVGEAHFPLMLKRCDLAAGHGVRRISSAPELDAALAVDPWAGHPVILQEYVSGGPDYVTHAVCVRGDWVWSATFEYRAPAGNAAALPGSESGCVEVDPGRSVLDSLQTITKELGYTGPCNIDFRVRDGVPIVFEVNPRLGYSLMRPEHVLLLAQALEAIVSCAQVGQAA